MAEDRPTNVVEGASSAAAADIDEETQPVAKSAEDRKAAAALSKLDATGDEEAAGHVDHEAAANALSAIFGTDNKKEVKKVKVDAADVALLVEELEFSKPKATELLKAHDGDAVKALKAYLQPGF
ncbi:hypothetical protein QBC38DRAFT_478327 [Podospora fimiseda]|uniref:Nascent polypeptide-associated complex subunit alpha-like UBA domain-containing protein n=1 Tax=Podospora fimiseda TaxID=252190 RepID=A0AAN7H2H5_9PEZI|nr:hypothetical protein QBC38DRAFT_478327 [Podospora fimiseda]